jgi:hypothetical protein
MKKASNFEVLSKMVEENNQNLHMYLEGNIRNMKLGKGNGWIEIGVANDDIKDSLTGKNRRFMLLTFLDEDYQKIKEELESQ